MNIRLPMSESESMNHDTWIENHTRNPPLFWPWPEQDQFLGSVQRLADNAESVMLLLGPTGVGKTTFAYRMQTQIPDHWIFCRLNANPQLHVYQLLQILIQKIGLNHAIPADLDDPNVPIANTAKNAEDREDTEEMAAESKPLIFFDEAYLADTLHNHFSNLRLQGRLPVVLIDDADQIPFNTLWYLLYLHQRNIEGLNAFSLILLARPTIETQINQAQKYADSSLKLQYLNMPRLASEQTASYVLYFFAAANMQYFPRWNQERFTIIYHQAQGLPGQIKELAKFTLRDDTKPRKFLWIRRLILLLAGMSATAAIGFSLLQFNITSELLNTWLNNVLQENQQNVWISKPLPLPITTPLQTPTDPLNVNATHNNSLNNTNPNPSTAILNNEFTPETNKIIDNANNLLPQPTITPALKSHNSLSTPLLPESKPASTSNNNPILANTPSTIAPPSTPVAPLPMQRNAWVLQQPNTNYTLQINNASSVEAAERYIVRNKLENKAFYIKAPHNNNSTVYVLHGTYATRIEANAAIHKLAPNLRKKKPFPISFQKLQTTIQNRH